VSTSERKRLFIAAPVPESWRPWLKDSQLALERALPGYFRWMGQDTWPLTVLFLGTQPAFTVPRIEHALTTTAHLTRSFELSAGDLSAPGQLGRPRLVWLRCDDGGVLATAQRRLIDDLSSFSLDTAPFRAHVTLGRARKPAPVAFKEAIAALNLQVRPQPAVIDRLILFQSHLGPSAARYEALCEAELA
jgi:RNA 2',3'-cyclic 3'-phosphodiesterase